MHRVKKERKMAELSVVLGSGITQRRKEKAVKAKRRAHADKILKAVQGLLPKGLSGALSYHPAGWRRIAPNVWGEEYWTIEIYESWWNYLVRITGFGVVAEISEIESRKPTLTISDEKWETQLKKLRGKAIR
jgi:hypothetical protein